MVALLNTYLTQIFDLGILLTLGAVFQLLSQILRCWRPPFPLFAVTFFLQSFGMALQDTHSNNWVTSVKLAHRWLGFIHAMYALGCLVGPFVATPVASANEPSKWYLFYTALVGVGVINLVLVPVAFRDKMHLHFEGRKLPSRTPQTSSDAKPSAWAEMQKTLRTPAVWLLSLFFFFYLGAVITASGRLLDTF